MIEQGTVLRGVGGFYYIQVESGVVTCKPRGRLRLETSRLLVGDQVTLTRHGQDDWVVSKIHPRRSELGRPPIANVDQVVAVCSVCSPEPDLGFVDRMLVQAALHGLDCYICFNKADLDYQRAEALREMYAPLVRGAAATSAVSGQGLDVLLACLGGSISALAGPTGVGKSTLLNQLDLGLALETGEVSRKLKRGRHTTREVVLYPLKNGGFVADTPGFGRLELDHVSDERLQQCFDEIWQLHDQCRFRGCAHEHEPDCAVKDALSQGEIHQQRYESYIALLAEARSKRQSY